MGELLAVGRLQEFAFSAKGFAFDPRTGQSFSINETGVRTLELLVETGDVARAVERLAADCEVPAEVVEGAVTAFVHQLGRYLA
ncbi:MAG: PqqD family protein [Alphaproteobacteria bacterium]|nr:PqqD family protein [Alphaproteobacteria bacterium]